MPSNQPNPPEPPNASPVIFVVIVLAALLAIGGGGTLLWLNQSGSLGSTGGIGPGLVAAEYESGQQVNIWRNERWRPGSIKRKQGARYLVTFHEAGALPDEWVDSSRLQARLQK